MKQVCCIKCWPALKLILAFSILIFSTAVLGANVRDEFSADSYANNNGSDNWVGDWVDSEDGSATTGNLQVTGGALRLEGVFGVDPTVSRTVDLSGVSSPVILTFDLSTTNNLETNDQYSVLVSNSPTGTFTTLQTYTGNTTTSASFDISAFASATTTIRFFINANVIGGTEFILVDNVDVTYPDVAFTAQCLPDNADAAWTFDNTNNDSSPASHNPISGSSGFNSTDFLIGTHSGEFNGSQSIQYSDGTFLNQSQAAMTASFFIKPTSLSGSQFLFDEGGSTNGIAVRLNGSTLEAAVREGTVQQTITTPFPNDGGWHHIAVSYDSGDYSLYLDGSLINTIATGFGALAGHGDAGGLGGRIGGSSAFGNASGNFTGLMDHAAYYYSLISPSEIADIANCALIEPPSINKVFSPSIVSAGDSTVMTLTLSNSQAVSLNNIEVIDAMPPAMWLDSLTVGGTCVGFAFEPSVIAGDSLLTLQGGTMPANSSCTLVLDVRSNIPGSHSNITQGATVNGGVEGDPSNTATLTVTEDFTSVCTPSNIDNGSIFVNVDDDIYSLDLGSAKATFITTSPFATAINSLATDPRNYLVYYSDNNPAATNTQIYAYDMLSDTHIVVDGDVSDNGVVLGPSGLGTSGATYYNGSLYIGVEDLDIAYRIVLSGDGRSIVYASDIINLGAEHDFGDFVAANGKLYDFDRGPQRFRVFDLATLGIDLDVPSAFATQGGVQRNGETLWAISDRLNFINTSTGALDTSVDLPITTDGTTPIPDVPFDAAGCVATTSRIGDLIWIDEDADGVKDAQEQGVGGVTVQLIWDVNGNGVVDPGETDIRNTVTTSADGSYIFDQLTPGDYVVRVTDAAGVLGGALPTNDTDNDRPISLGLNQVIDTADFGYSAFFVIRGFVFDDDGSGGGIAHNALRESTESGFSSVLVSVTDPSNADALIASTLTIADGAYALFIPNSFSGSDIDITVITPGGFVSISENVSTTLATNPDTRDDVIRFTPTAGALYENVNFGDVLQFILKPSNARNVSPGQSAFYPHVFIAGSVGDVRFSTSSVETPADVGWNHTLHNDLDCSGDLSVTELAVSPIAPSDAFSVVADDEICLIVRVLSPSSAPVNASYLVNLAADFEYLNESPDGFTRQFAVSDLTTVVAAGLLLDKKVENISQGGAQVLSNSAVPGDELRYTIRFTNVEADNVSDIVVRDTVPAFTSLTSPVACPAILPLSLISCVVVVPDTANNIAGYEGPVEWQLEGELNPGGEGELTYSVTVE